MTDIVVAAGTAIIAGVGLGCIAVLVHGRFSNAAARLRRIVERRDAR